MKPINLAIASLTLLFASLALAPAATATPDLPSGGRTDGEAARSTCICDEDGLSCHVVCMPFHAVDATVPAAFCPYQTAPQDYRTVCVPKALAVANAVLEPGTWFLNCFNTQPFLTCVL